MENLGKVEKVKYFLSYATQIPLQKPKMINFGLTHRCNLRCKICETWEANPKLDEELTTNEIKKVISQIAEWGEIGISFAGGEPLVRKDDLLECIKHANAKGLKTHVTTNGTMINKKVADQLARSGLDFLQISLDGATEKTNDYIRGRNTFKKTMQAAKNILKSKKENNPSLKLSFTTVITNKNVDELSGILKIAETLGMHEVAFNPYNLDTSYTKNKSYDNEFWVARENIEKLENVCKELAEHKKNRGNIGTPEVTLRLLPEYFNKKNEFRNGLCLAGYSYMYVKPNGEVDVCGKGPSLSVKKMSIKQIWYSLTFLKTRLKITRCKKHCLMLCFPRIRII